MIENKMHTILFTWFLISSILVAFFPFLLESTDYKKELPKFLWYVTLPTKLIEYFFTIVIVVPVLIALLLKDPNILQELSNEMRGETTLIRKKSLREFFKVIAFPICMLTGLTGIMISFFIIRYF